MRLPYSHPANPIIRCAAAVSYSFYFTNVGRVIDNQQRNWWQVRIAGVGSSTACFLLLPSPVPHWFCGTSSSAGRSIFFPWHEARTPFLCLNIILVVSAASVFCAHDEACNKSRWFTGRPPAIARLVFVNDQHLISSADLAN